MKLLKGKIICNYFKLYEKLVNMIATLYTQVVSHKKKHAHKPKQNKNFLTGV